MKSLIAVAVGAMTLCSAVSAAPVTVTFEGLGNNSPVGNYYNGGGGTNYGISFDNQAQALVGSVSGNFSGEPGPGDTIMTWSPGSTTVVTMAAGWTGSFSFYYAGLSDLAVSVLDAAGSSIGSSGALAGVGGTGCTGNDVLCTWKQYTINFAGTATSVSFTGLAAEIAVDNLTFGSVNNGGNVPEPGTLALTALALGLAAVGARRRSA